MHKPGQIIFDNTGMAVGMVDANGKIVPLSISMLLGGADYAMYDKDGNLISRTPEREIKKGDLERGYQMPFQNWDLRHIDMGQDWGSPNTLDIEDGQIDGRRRKGREEMGNLLHRHSSVLRLSSVRCLSLWRECQTETRKLA